MIVELTLDTSEDIASRPPCPHEEGAKKNIKLWQQIVAACSGALLTSTIVTPFDVVKTRLQTQQKYRMSSNCRVKYDKMDHLSNCEPCHGTRPAKTDLGRPYYKNTLDAFVKIPKTEGFKVLWSGLGPSLVLAIPATVVYFVSYERLVQKSKETHDGKLPLWAPLLAGSTARTAATVLVSPLELIRTKMQSQRMKYVEIVYALRAQMSENGYRGLWRGLGPTLLRDVPFSGVYWLNYELFKSQFCDSGVPTLAFTFLAGAASGSIAAVVTTPSDVIKTHQQVELGEKKIFSDPSESPTKSHTTTYELFWRIYHENGIKGLFSGLTPRLMKVVPACAIMISSFEFGKRILASR